MFFIPFFNSAYLSAAASAFNSSKVVLYLRFGYKFVCLANKYSESLEVGSTKAPLAVDTWSGVGGYGQGKAWKWCACKGDQPL